MTTMRVLIADDHLFYREGVRALLGNAPDITIVGEAGSGDEVVARAAEQIGRACVGKECQSTCRSRWSPYH